MKDQYSFLKAIDTSSSSPELLNEAEVAHRRSRQKTPRQQLQPLKLSIKQTAQSNGLTPVATTTTTTTNSSSSINSKTPGKLLKGNILTNLVRPIKFHSQPQQQQVSTTAMRKSQTEKLEASDLRDRLFLLTGKQQPGLKSSQSGAKLLGAPRLSQPPVAATLRSHTSRHHHHHVVPPPAAQPSYHTNKTTSSGAVKPLIHYLPSETAQTQGQQPELGRCYDEIDQIYDYIRGLAPLPANLRKLKSIDFEQLERDRQKLAERQQKQIQVQHHQHRERYVRSIDDSTSAASSQPSAPSGSAVTKRLVKVRQRDASDQTSVGTPPLPPVASAQVAPRPIRVTTRSSESARPSIKRVESLNLGQKRPEEEEAATEQVKQNLAASRRQIEPLTTTATTTGLTKPSYLISTTQRGQVFRLPRAHSTSTLNKPALAGATGSRRASQATGASSKEPVIPENLPLARLSVGRHEPGFESDLVESFVDDDVTPVETGQQQVATREDDKSNSSSSSSSGSSSTSSEGDDDEAQSAGSSSSSQASERLSQKSHSDYDNDSDANTSETTETTSSETTTNTSNDEKNEEDELEEVRARARALKREHHNAGKTSSSMSPFSGTGTGGGGGSSSAGKRSQRPTTSSSPSSGRPASPTDETQPESDGPEAASVGRGESTQRRKSASTSSSYRHRHNHHLPMSIVQPAPREEHIYEQIPAHKTREMATTGQRLLCADHPIGMTATTSQSTLTRRVGGGGAQKPVIKHPVAYAANVAVNRRYQQQVAALFALQQQRDRQLVNVAQPPVAPQLLHQGHRRRASASNTQFLPQWRQANNSSSNHHHHHHHEPNHLSSVPHRHRLSMGNIHLLTSAIPLASLYSPKTRNVPLMSSGEAARAKEERHRRRSQANANSLDDHEAGSTGTTNSTSSYEAAIKNSEPNPLRIDMLAPTLDGAHEQRHSAGRRSVGSGSGSRSLSNHLQMHNVSTHHLHQQPQQHSSSLVKVPKLSKQSHLLQRPLPKPPNHHCSSSSSKQPASKSTNRTTTTRPPVIDVFN